MFKRSIRNVVEQPYKAVEENGLPSRTVRQPTKPKKLSPRLILFCSVGFAGKCAVAAGVAGGAVDGAAETGKAAGAPPAAKQDLCTTEGGEAVPVWRPPSPAYPDPSLPLPRCQLCRRPLPRCHSQGRQLPKHLYYTSANASGGKRHPAGRRTKAKPASPTLPRPPPATPPSTLAPLPTK